MAGSARSSQDRERAYRPAYGFHSGQYSCTLKSISGGTYRGRLGAPVHCILHQKYLCAKNMNLSNVMDVVRTINFIRSKGLNHMSSGHYLMILTVSMGIYSSTPRNDWMEHLERMEDDRIPKFILNYKPKEILRHHIMKDEWNGEKFSPALIQSDPGHSVTHNECTSAHVRTLCHCHTSMTQGMRSKQASRSSTRVCVRICVSIRRPEFECSGSQLEGPEFECSGPQLEGPESEYSELSLKFTIPSSASFRRNHASFIELIDQTSLEMDGGLMIRKLTRNYFASEIKSNPTTFPNGSRLDAGSVTEKHRVQNLKSKLKYVIHQCCKSTELFLWRCDFTLFGDIWY
ncbi:hypothetical protein ANN_16965 [Periplaneta americana]|uniref:Uncharacterized protein n=1 Tax=Periplaneta americana TaxID=6978 RepID=A0ABQ8SSD9_PERAM|nr:hypothetical protein ANN_16965 [Periplaneta americana]